MPTLQFILFPKTYPVTGFFFYSFNNSVLILFFLQNTCGDKHHSGNFNSMGNREVVSNWFKALQKNIISALEGEESTSRFGREEWQREGGGGGLTCLLKDGEVFEKAGVNFSAVYGRTPEAIQKSFNTDADSFYATGVSIVIHPVNPFVPIIHMNIRYFELSNGQCWFGGGIDLTPAYVFPEDCLFFHSGLKRSCDTFDKGWYARFKENADKYFTIKHRQETRGIGGIFYDRLSAADPGDFDLLWNFTKTVGESFVPIYLRIVQDRRETPFSEANKFWQLHRRSRYVEFNLIYDSGTKFGLETNGRTESILMSLPPVARWESNFEPEPGSAEALSQSYFKISSQWC